MVDWAVTLFAGGFLASATLYAILPVVLKLLPSIVAQGTFLNLVCVPKCISCLHMPKKRWKLNGVENHYILSNGTRLGLWHFMPQNYSYEVTNDCSLAGAEKVVIYCHGNAGHRGVGHRKHFYQVLTKLGYHVITFDYRGYGDSHGWPSEEGVIEDTTTVYNWVVQEVSQKDCEIIVWGHSLGSAIATLAVLRIQNSEVSVKPAALVLEAAFTSAAECITEYPLSKYVAKLYPGKWIYSVLLNALSAKGIFFTTVDALPLLSCDIMLLHARDDRKVPFKLGRKLFDTINENFVSLAANVAFIAFKASHNLGHCGIYKHPLLPALIEDFVQKKGSFSTIGRRSQMEL